MLSKYVTVGDKIEFTPLTFASGKAGDEKKKIFFSQVYDILSEDKIEIGMPMEKQKLILLPVGLEITICFFTSFGLYQCKGRISERYKRNNMYLLLIDITSQLNKQQRREYYRYSCAIDILARSIEDEEIVEVDNKQVYNIDTTKPMEKGVIVDISGGGIRFVSEAVFEKGCKLFCRFALVVKAEVKKYETKMELLYVKPVENKKGFSEYRAHFIDLDSRAREEIIQFIFEEERKYRKKEKG